MNMMFSERLKKEREKAGWSQAELAEKLHVSRQSVSKWETGKNYPSIETVIHLSDLFGITIDALLRSDEELKEKVIQDGRQLAYPKWKLFFDVLVVIGLLLVSTRILIAIGNRFLNLDITFFKGSILYMVMTFTISIIGAIGSEALAKKYKEE